MAAEKELRLPENSSTSSAAGNMRLKRLIKPPVQPVVLGFIGCERPERYSFTARKFLFLGALFRPCGCSVLAPVPFSRSLRFRACSVLALVPFSRSFRFRGRSVFAAVPFSRPFRPDIAPISRPLRHSGCMAGMPGRRRRGSDLSLLEKQGRGPVRQSPVFPGLYTNRRVST